MQNWLYGRVVLSVTLVLLSYYTLWVIALPFVDDDYNFLVQFFPPVEVALGIPALLGTITFVGLFLRAYYLVVQDRKLENQ